MSNYSQSLSNLFDKPMLTLINLLYYFDKKGLLKITHIISEQSRFIAQTHIIGFDKPILEIAFLDMPMEQNQGDSVIKVSGGQTPTVLSRAVQLIKLLPRAATWSYC